MALSLFSDLSQMPDSCIPPGINFVIIVIVIFPGKAHRLHPEYPRCRSRHPELHEMLSFYHCLRMKQAETLS